MQVQEPKWFITLHSAFTPQSPGQGSTHFWFLHALSEGHSAFVEHSGLQATYGSPKYSGMHWHAAALFLSEQTALDPHGEGLQGLIISVGTTGVVILWHATKASPV
jgi:hypothetical protein